MLFESIDCMKQECLEINDLFPAFFF